MTMTIGRLKMNYTAETLLSDIDRCPHGRHAGDVCSGWRGPGEFDGGCRGGVSLGNPLLAPGTVIGTGIGGTFMIRVPLDRNDRHDPKAWYVAREDGDDRYATALADAVYGKAVERGDFS
jgi:hypothetical protein